MIFLRKRIYKIRTYFLYICHDLAYIHANLNAETLLEVIMLNPCIYQTVVTHQNEILRFCFREKALKELRLKEKYVILELDAYGKELKKTRSRRPVSHSLFPFEVKKLS